MDIGAAFTNLKAGRAVARSGWLGRGVMLCFVPSLTIKIDAPVGIFPPGTELRLNNFVAIASSGTLMPWKPTDTDLLADDWLAIDTGPPKMVEPSPETPMPDPPIEETAAT